MTKTSWSFIAVSALMLAAAAAMWRENNPAWAAWQARYNAEVNVTPLPVGVKALIPTSTGKPELCITCHGGIEDISASHPAQTFGCIVCHGGDPLALDADRAHATMRGGRNPSDPSVAAESCSQPNCHGGYADEEQNHVDRVLKSLQATYAGGIATVRYTFGMQSSPTAQFGIHAVSDDSRPLPPNALAALQELLPTSGTVDDARIRIEPVESQVRIHAPEATFQQTCLNGGCHLSAVGQSQPYYYHSTGCAACHYLYADDGLYRGGDPTIPRDQPGHGALHQLTTAIPYTQCDHCHNRGNYSLKQMAFLPRDDLPPVAAPVPDAMPPEGRRLKEYYQPIAEFTKCEVELDCVDCHTAQEAMGNGHIYGTKKDSQYIQCQTCHGTLTSKPQLAQITDANELAMRQARINGHADFLGVGDRVIETARGELLWAIKQVAPDHFVQMGKVTGQQYNVPLIQGSKCKQNGTDQSSQYCHQCHSVAR